MAWIAAILKAIPALSRLGELLERNIKRGTVEARKKRKLDRVDAAIADALDSSDKRLRGNEAGSIGKADEGVSKGV